MAKPYSLDLRERAMARLVAGESSTWSRRALNALLIGVDKWAASELISLAAPRRRRRLGGHRLSFADQR